MLVDTEGLVLAVHVHAASVQEAHGAAVVFGALGGRFPRLRLVWADGGYAFDTARRAAEAAGLTLEIVRKAEGQRGFVALPRRWVVERTFGWLVRYRRLRCDYETRPESSEGWIRLAMVHLMARRLAPT